MTTPAPSWVTLEALKNDQTLDGTLSTRDDEALQRALNAAMAWVQDHRPDLDYHGAWTVPLYVQLGTIRLAARWFVRRVSPDGLVNMGTLGTGNVMASDPDIYMQLGILGGLS
ncbi:MAG: hypothetical protein ACRDQU_00885 [Pseudonocardiaceae bacterium]